MIYLPESFQGSGHPTRNCPADSSRIPGRSYCGSGSFPSLVKASLPGSSPRKPPSNVPEFFFSSWPDRERKAGLQKPALRPTSGVSLPFDHRSTDRSVINLTQSRSMPARLAGQFFGQNLALSTMVVYHPAFWRKIFRPGRDKPPLHKPLS